MFAPTVTMDKINPKDCQVASPLVIQGFSNFFGLFQVIMANPTKQETVEDKNSLLKLWRIQGIGKDVPRSQRTPSWEIP